MNDDIGPLEFYGQSIIPGYRTPETQSEKLFADYLNATKHTGWLFEPTIGCHRQHPDFLVPLHSDAFLFEVKERAHKDVAPGPCWYDPMRGIREEITESQRKFTEFKEFPCALVIYNAGDPDTLLEPEYVFGGMLGDPGFSMVFDTERCTSLPETARNVFLRQGGKMMRYKTRDFQNTRINAIIVLEQCTLRNRAFENATSESFSKKSLSLGRELTERERGIAVVEAWKLYRPLYERVTRVRVCTNPGARKPLAATLFKGDYDEWWSVADGHLERIFAGSRVLEIQD